MASWDVWLILTTPIKIGTMQINKNIYIDIQIDRWMDRQIDRWMDRQMDRQIDEQMYMQIYRKMYYNCRQIDGCIIYIVCKQIINVDIQIEVYTYRQMYIQNR